MKKLLALCIALLIVASLGAPIALATEGHYVTPMSVRPDGCPPDG